MKKGFDQTVMLAWPCGDCRSRRKCARAPAVVLDPGPQEHQESARCSTHAQRRTGQSVRDWMRHNSPLLKSKAFWWTILVSESGLRDSHQSCREFGMKTSLLDNRLTLNNVNGMHAAHTETDDLANDISPSGPGMFKFFDNYDAGAISQNETISVSIPGA